MGVRLPFHYGWVIVVAGTLTVFACIGLGRFALGMLLPSMGTALDLSYAQMGIISTGYFVGYLVAVMAAGTLDRRFGARRTIAAALAVVGGSMILVGRADSFAGALALYVLTGAGSAAANVPAMALVSRWFHRRRRGSAAGYMVMGNGFAIVFAGYAIPAINTAAGAAEGWRLGWAALGATVLTVAAICALIVRDRPAEVGAEPHGDEPSPAADTTNATNPPAMPDPPAAKPAPSSRGIVAHLGIVYALFGATYVIYATFIVTTLVDERGFSEATAGQFWAWVGVLSLVSGPLFGTLSDRLGRRAGLIMVFALQMCAYAVVAAPLPDAFLYLSIALFGVSAWSIPSIMAAAVGDYLGPERAATSFATVTLIFSVGQLIGPAAAGAAAEAAGGFWISYVMAATLAAAAIVATAFLRPPTAGTVG